MQAIGYFRSGAHRRYDAPRQGVFGGGEGVVELLAGRDFETALRDLEGFERIWLVFQFHLNGAKWRPTARPPVPPAGRNRVGLFATRSPYRPNPIGLSAVKLVRIDGLRLHVAEADLLDGSPVLDIKPYIPAADSFPDAAAGWLAEQSPDEWRVSPAPEFLAAASRIAAAGGPDLVRECVLQLSRDPFDHSRKRVAKTETGGVLSLRMFRVAFSADEASHVVMLQKLYSGYTPEELAAPGDPYCDKDLHKMLGGSG